MVDRVDTARVYLWGILVGAVAWDPEKGFATFEFDQAFSAEELDVSPIQMPIAQARGGSPLFSFRTLSPETFMGLPGMLADSLPDRYGNQIINRWLASQGRTPESFSPIERLCYVGKRGMGALEFRPAVRGELEKSVFVEVDKLVELAQMVTAERSTLSGDIHQAPSEAILDILRVGTSAGGARPKAVIAVNDTTGELRSGQVSAPEGFDYWILKFDGVHDSWLGDGAGYGRTEYAYYKMAIDAGIEMTQCRLLEEKGRAHFMARRFDRTGQGHKLHVQSLCGLAHFDYNDQGAYSYEQVFAVMRQLRLSYAEGRRLFRRMVFNIVARNQDDHTKNIAFLMGRDGRWQLAPAFDVTFSYRPDGPWTKTHQMSANGKRDDFSREDLMTVARRMDVKAPGEIIDHVLETVRSWPDFAQQAGMNRSRIDTIGKTHRLL